MVTAAINGSTKVMGVIGDPIAQVMTPTAINPIFADMGANITCIPIHLRSGALAAGWAGLRAIESVIGFGVTIPHKQSALKLCDSLDPVAERTGAVNVVRRETDGSFRGYQFDGRGFVRGLQRQGNNVEGKDCLLIGAGGAAVAVAFALVEQGINSLTVANRTRVKANDLAETVNRLIGRTVASVGEPIPPKGSLVVNATSLGLSGHDPLPIDPATIDDTMLVAEVVAKPETTAFLAAASERGAAVHSGIHMINGQVDMIADHMAKLWA